MLAAAGSPRPPLTAGPGGSSVAATSRQSRRVAMGASSSRSAATPPPAPESAFSACARPDVAAALRGGYDDLGGWPAACQLPVLYNPCYNIGFWGIERLHPFDSKKFQRVLAILEGRGVLAARQLVTAAEASQAVLAEAHSEQYLRRLHGSAFKVAMVTELAPLLFLPAFLLRRKVLSPMATMAGGTMVAAALAMERGWAINLGGGMHHAHHDDGGGWCPFADINLAVRRLRAASGGAVRRVMVVDLDVHQGNGVARCKQHYGDADLFVVDVYNGQLYPRDVQAKQAIDVKRELRVGTGDEEYLAAVGGALEEAFEVCQPPPDLLIYNAGTDVLQGDPLGRLEVTPAGVRARDELVWRAALEHRVPIVQVLSGGYTRESTPVIADSLTHLFATFGLGGGTGAAPASPAEAAPTAAAAGEL